MSDLGQTLNHSHHHCHFLPPYAHLPSCALFNSSPRVLFPLAMATSHPNMFQQSMRIKVRFSNWLRITSSLIVRYSSGGLPKGRTSQYPTLKILWCSLMRTSLRRIQPILLRCRDQLQGHEHNNYIIR
jgi:hypothetical protein